MKHKVLISILIFISLLSLALKLIWMALSIFVFSVLFLLFSSELKPFVWIRKEANTLFISIIFFFVLAITMRVFLFEIYSISSGSMQDTLLPGDKVLVSKLYYGPRMPRSPFEIPWVNLFFYINKRACASTDSFWYNYKRLNGYSKIKRGDVIVFNFPHKKETFYIKRCIGLSGETFEIRNGTVLCDKQEVGFPTKAKIKYRVWVNDMGKFVALIDSMKLPNYGLFNDRRKPYREITLNRQEYNIIEYAACVDSIGCLVVEADTVPHVYPYSKQFLWTFDNYGPVVVPRKGMEIELTPNNFYLYKKIFNECQGEKLVLENNQVVNNGNPVESYKFKQDYYFMMGDNRYNSLDSRHWGFVPEQGIIGKAMVVLFSKDNYGVKWDRTLMLLH